MKEELEKLRIGRIKLKVLGEELKAKQILFNAENKDLLDNLDKVISENMVFDLNIRNQAVELFAENGLKKLECGIGIRETTKYTYKLEEAYNWAVEHAICLKLDEKAFKKIQSVKVLDFVQVSKEVTATIPKNIPNEAKEGV